MSYSQIVNVESQRIQSDSTGWLGNVGSGFLFQKNAVKVISISANAHVEYKSRRSLYLLLIEYNFLKGNEATFNNDLFYHVRYNYKLNKWLRWEVFTQMQQNNIAGIKLRWLTGTGPRFKISGNKKLSLYAGIAAMYELEKEQTKPVIHHRDLRSSSYVSLTYNPSENSEIVGAFFFQPLFKEFSDNRVLNEIMAKFNAT